MCIRDSANTWDYGPLGVELKNNVKNAWWDAFIRKNPHNVGVDCAILMNPEVWVASGPVSYTHLKYIVTSPVDRVYRFAILPEFGQELASLVEEYVVTHTGQNYASLNFMKKNLL